MESIIFSMPEETWDRIKNTYRTTFKDLVLGEMPIETDLIDTLKRIHDRLVKVKWIV